MGRPHYHACLFGFDFPDKEMWKVSNGNRLYTSKILDEVWGLGHAVIGDLTFESAAYVARYILKKVTGKSADAHYNGRRPEYVTMSRRPGIGRSWFDKFKSDVFPHDYVVVRGVKMLPPKFYDRVLELTSPKEFAKIKNGRVDRARAVPYSERHGARLYVKERVKRAQIQSLCRNLEAVNAH